MTTILIPIIDKPKEYSKAISSIASVKDFSIVVGTTRSLEKQLSLPKSVTVEYFKDGSKKEEIINSMQQHLGNGKNLIARRPFIKEEIEKLNSSSAQVTYLAKPRKSGFVMFFVNLLSTLVKFLFGVDFFDGDISLVEFDQDLSQVLSSVSNLSYATRVDRWRGVEQFAVDGNLPPVKMEINLARNYRLLIYAILALLLPIAITLIVCLLTRVGFVVGMVLFCACAIGMFAFALMMCTYFFNLIVGDRLFKKAERD